MPCTSKFYNCTLAGILAACLLVTSPLMASSNDIARTITLSATGSVDSKPDMASISTGIESVAVKARDALDDNNDVMTRMMESLKQAGLEDRDIATTQFSVQPRYQRVRRRPNNNQPQAPRIIGYTVSNSLRITVRKLDELGRILDRLVTLGSNRFNGISFGIKDADSALDEARTKAMRKAIDKARLYARAANVTLGPITSISEQANHSSPRPMAFRAKRSMAMAVPIAPGQHKTNVTVHVTWTLED